MTETAERTHPHRGARRPVLGRRRRLRVVPGVGARREGRATILERDDEGRGLRVEYRAAALGKSIRYVLEYDYSEAPESFSWKFVEGDMLRRLDGTYRFEAEAPTSTRVHYELAVELAVPLARAGEAPRRRPHHGQRVEGAEEAGRSGRVMRAAERFVTIRALARAAVGEATNLARPMRILLFTGKGGVGKTTVAAATAARAVRGRAAHDRLLDRSRALARRRVRRARSATARRRSRTASAASS